MDENERIGAYLTGRLSAPDAQAFENRLAADPTLRAEVAALRAATAQMAEDDSAIAARPDGWDRLSAAIDAETRGTPANDNRRPVWWQMAAAAAVAVLAWQVFAVPFLMDRAGSDFVPASAATTEFALRVSFADTAEIAAVSVLLGEIGATIIDGPGALGLYTLSFADADARDKAEAALAAQDAIVTLVTRP